MVVNLSKDLNIESAKIKLLYLFNIGLCDGVGVKTEELCDEFCNPVLQIWPSLTIAKLLIDVCNLLFHFSYHLFVQYYTFVDLILHRLLNF